MPILNTVQLFISRNLWLNRRVWGVLNEINRTMQSRRDFFMD